MSGKSGSYRIRIRKEALKFSAAHMTVFRDGTKERLHGHNYRTELGVEFSDFAPDHSLETMVSFSEFKSILKNLCGAWDEKVLLPAKCPFLKIISKSVSSAEIELCGKRYVFPADEVEFLPVDNITTETLARILSDAFVAALPKEMIQKGRITRIDMTVDETEGQGATYSHVPN